jgi:NADPH:quinone reductase-like Zn-dependent oxidoreductase
MRAIWITRHGGPEVLEVREQADPAPGPGQVRVRVHAAGLNFSELLARQGLYPEAPRPPCVVGFEISGVIDALGAGVASRILGTRVMAPTRFGGHADLVCVQAQHAYPIPDTMSFAEAAALPVSFATAYHMLHHVARLRPGARVLVHMAAGSVGLAVLQLCRGMPGVQIFGTASRGKHELLRAQGCHHPLEHEGGRYVRAILDLTDGEGVDIVLDALGGRHWELGYGLLRPAGILIAFGFASASPGDRRSPAAIERVLGEVPRFSPLTMMMYNRAVAGVHIGRLFRETDLLDDYLQALVGLYREGQIRPIIDTTFGFDQVQDAHRRLHARENVGKVILQP